MPHKITQRFYDDLLGNRDGYCTSCHSLITTCGSWYTNPDDRKALCKYCKCTDSAYGARAALEDGIFVICPAGEPGVHDVEDLVVVEGKRDDVTIHVDPCAERRSLGLNYSNTMSPEDFKRQYKARIFVERRRGEPQRIEGYIWWMDMSCIIMDNRTAYPLSSIRSIHILPEEIFD